MLIAGSGSGILFCSFDSFLKSFPETIRNPHRGGTGQSFWPKP